MARRPKRSPVPYTDVERIQREVNKLAPSHMPDDADLRGRIIIALTERFRSFLPEHYNHIRGNIVAIAKFEAVQGLSTEEKASHIQLHLKRLASEPPFKQNHSQHNLALQREALVDYLLAELYPHGKGLKEGFEHEFEKFQMDWLEQRWGRIMELLTPIPCFCQYEQTYKAFVLKSEQYYKPVTPAMTADLVLSSLHDTIDPESVRKRSGESLP